MTCLQTGNYTLELEYTLIFSGSFAKLQKKYICFYDLSSGACNILPTWAKFDRKCKICKTYSKSAEKFDQLTLAQAGFMKCVKKIRFK